MSLLPTRAFTLILAAALLLMPTENGMAVSPETATTPQDRYVDEFLTPLAVGVSDEAIPDAITPTQQGAYGVFVELGIPSSVRDYMHLAKLQVCVSVNSSSPNIDCQLTESDGKIHGILLDRPGTYAITVTDPEGRVRGQESTFTVPWLNPLDGSLNNFEYIRGDFQPVCDGQPAWYGSLGPDKVSYASFPDNQDDLKGITYFQALDGNDKLIGGSGEEHWCGGPGHDRFSGKGGNDYFDGGSGNDNANGGAGNDRLLGGKGKDKLIGKSGNDVLLGGKGKDTCRGGSGKDRTKSC